MPKLTAGENVTLTINVGADTLTVEVLSETVRDLVATFLQAGTGITVTHDDPGNTFTIAATGPDTEAVRDLIGSVILAGAGVTSTVDDPANTVTLAVDAEFLSTLILSTILPGTGITTEVDEDANTITISAPENLSAEDVRDTIGTALVAGANITITVNDAGDTITIASTGGAGYTAENARDDIGAALVEGAGIDITVSDGSDTITIASTITQYTDEMVRDIIGAALVAGTGIDITVSDVGDTITIGGGGAGYTEEQIEDIVNGLILAGTGITKTYDDVANTLTLEASDVGSGDQAGVPNLLSDGWIVGKWYGAPESFPSGGSAPNYGTFNPGTSKVLYSPIFVPRTINIDRLGLEVVSGAAAGNITFALYDNTSEGLPGTRVIDGGTVSHATTGQKEVTVAYELIGGRWYWGAFSLGAAGVTVRYINTEAYVRRGTATPGAVGETALLPQYSEATATPPTTAAATSAVGGTYIVRVRAAA